MKKSVYLDSTIPSYLFDQRDSLRFPCDMTRQWWETEKSYYDIFVSAETIAELGRGNYPRKKEILEAVKDLPQLDRCPDISDIVECYINHMLMPKDEHGDAVHLAYASYYKIDFLLTWNCNHLANANKQQHIRIINARLGLYTPEITTPLQLFTERR